MSTIDIEAEREKIQREIEALERSLDPNAAPSEVVVSIASDDSDDDDLDMGYGEWQTDDVALEDGDDSVEICLQMNLVYQAVIEEKLQELEILIVQNKGQQEQLLWELAGRKTERAGMAKAYPSSLAVGHFSKPFFKDKFSGVGPPANQEMIERSAHIVKTFKEFTSKKWRPSYHSELRQAIISDTLQRMLQPKLLKLEYLQQKRDNAKSDIDRKILTKQIQETEREIDDINQLPEQTLMGQRSDEHDWEKISNINFEGDQSAKRLRRIWKNYEHPHINKEPWEDDEIQKLQEIAKNQHFINWEEIAQELGTKRTAFQCLQRFQHSNKAFKRKAFTKEEDEILTHFVQRMRVGDHIPYRKIAYFMEGRDSMQLLTRWSKSLDPSLTKGPWSKAEDEMLLKAVAKYGEKDWYKIRLEVPGRCDIQCRERYYKGLHKDVKKGKWNQEEIEKLIELTEKYGVGHWTKVGNEITHRTGSQCLSKWKHITGYFKRRKQKQGNVKRRRKKIKNEVLSEEEAGMSSSDSSSYSFSASNSDTEDSSMESMSHSEEDPDHTRVLSHHLESIPDLDLWIPKRKFPDSYSKSLIICSAASGSAQIARTKIPRKGTGATFQFNTILKGIAYPASTDTVTESPDGFLLEAADSGCQMLQIRENDVRKVLRRNTKLFQEKQVQRLRRKHTKCPAESAIDNPGDGASEKSLSRFSMSQLYKGSEDRKLLFAVTPWVGNVFLPLSANYGTPWRSRTHADLVRKRLQSVSITSTPMFTLLIQMLQIDAQGCLQMIRLRKVNESEFLTSIRSCTMKTDPLSPKSILVSSFNKQEPKAKAPQLRPDSKPTPQGKPCVSPPSKPAPKVSAPGATQKPKTVYELLMEKRMRQLRAKKASQNAGVLSPNILVPPQMLIQQQPRPVGQPQPMVINMASPNTQNAVWPVMPFITLTAGKVILPNNKAVSQISSASDGSTKRPGKGAGRNVPVSLTTKAPESLNSKVSRGSSPSQAIAGSQTVISQQASLQLFHTARNPAANSSPTPVTWLVTPQSLVPFPSQALSFSSPTQPPINQVTRDVSTSLQARAIKTSTNETSVCKVSEVPVDLNKSNNEALLAAKSSLSQEVTAMPTADVHLVPPAVPHLPIIASAPNVSNRSCQFTLTPKKYPVVRIAKLLPSSDDPKVSAVKVSENGKPNPIQSNSTQTSAASAKKNMLDVSLISLEEEASVKEWLQGGRGVEVPSVKSGMAYLPPSICTLKTLSRILLQKKALEEFAFKLLPHVEDVETMTSSRQQEILNDLVEQKLKDNPAYHILKQRFLSAFTFPGLLAIYPPAKSKSAKMKMEESDEDSDGSVYTEPDRDQDRPGRTADNSSSAQSEDVPSGEAVARPSEQAAALEVSAQCQSLTADNFSDRRITRKSAQCRRLR